MPYPHPQDVDAVQHFPPANQAPLPAHGGRQQQTACRFHHVRSTPDCPPLPTPPHSTRKPSLPSARSTTLRKATAARKCPWRAATVSLPPPPAQNGRPDLTPARRPSV